MENGDEKVEEIKELNYRGVRAMPYVIGIYILIPLYYIANIYT